MPKEFCFNCGDRHDLSDLDTCAKNSSSGAVGTRTTHSASRIAKANITEELSEIESSVSALSLEERKKRALQEIAELKLEDELAEL